MKKTVIVLGGIISASAFLSCKEPDMATVSYPSHGYPGPSRDEPTTYDIVNTSTDCNLPEVTESQKWCVSNVAEFNAGNCGYSQLVDYCKASWALPENAQSIKSMIRGCQLNFRTSNKTYFFDRTDLNAAGILSYCQSDPGLNYKYHTWRFSATGDGNSNSLATGTPYQGQYINKERQIRITINNWSKSEFTDENQIQIASFASQIVTYFGREVWNFSEGGELLSFPVSSATDVLLENKATGEFSTRYLCPMMSPNDESQLVRNCTDAPSEYFAGDYIFSHSRLRYAEGYNGVSPNYIDINVMIVDDKYATVDSKSGIALRTYSIGYWGEINTTPQPEGFVVWYYAKSKPISLTTLAHEIGHALLHYHEKPDWDIGDIYDGLMLSEFPGNRTHPSYPSIRPYKSTGLSVNGLPGEVSLYVDRMLIWPTAEGYTVDDGSNMNHKSNSEGE